MNIDVIKIHLALLIVDKSTQEAKGILEFLLLQRRYIQ